MFVKFWPRGDCDQGSESAGHVSFRVVVPIQGTFAVTERIRV